MKKIINGKIYNTETATIVAEGDNGLNIGDCWRRSEELYRTPRGNYFIYDSRPNILPVNSDGKILEWNGYEYEWTGDIKNWLHEWNISSLAKRECKLFKITEA